MTFTHKRAACNRCLYWFVHIRLKNAFPWFIIQTALVNGALAVLCLYLLITIIASADGGLAVILSPIVLGFGTICCFNLYSYIFGKENERFNQRLQGRFQERLRRGRQ